MNLFTKIDHCAINVSDIDKSIKFYHEVFGFKLLFDNVVPNGMRVIYLILNDTILELAQSSKVVKNSHFCLHTNDFDQAVIYLESKGLEYSMKAHRTNPRSIGEENWGRAVFLGLDDEEIEIRGFSDGYANR